MSHTLTKKVPTKHLIKIRGEDGHEWRIEHRNVKILCVNCGIEHWEYQDKPCVCSIGGKNGKNVEG